MVTDPIRLGDVGRHALLGVQIGVGEVLLALHEAPQSLLSGNGALTDCSRAYGLFRSVSKRSTRRMAGLPASTGVATVAFAALRTAATGRSDDQWGPHFPRRPDLHPGWAADWKALTGNMVAYQAPGSESGVASQPIGVLERREPYIVQHDMLRSSQGFHIACSHARTLVGAARRNAGVAMALEEKPGGSDER